jgi:hypothetical protein
MPCSDGSCLPGGFELLPSEFSFRCRLITLGTWRSPRRLMVARFLSRRMSLPSPQAVPDPYRQLAYLQHSAKHFPMAVSRPLTSSLVGKAVGVGSSASICSAEASSKSSGIDMRSTGSGSESLDSWSRPVIQRSSKRCSSICTGSGLLTPDWSPHSTSPPGGTGVMPALSLGSSVGYGL